MRPFAGAAAALIVLVGVAWPVRAQDVPTVKIEEENTNIGTSAAEFLTLGAGARGMVLGGAFGAIVRDAEALYYNPAGLPLLDGPQAMLTVMPYFAETDYFWGGFAFPFAGGQYGIGVQIGNFGFSDQPIYTEADPEGESGRTYSVSETFVGLSLAHAFIDRFTGGVTLKFISDELAQTRATGFALDIGTNFHTELGNRPIAVSFVLQNVGTSLRHTVQGVNFTSFPPSAQDVPNSNVDPNPARFETQAFALPVFFRVAVAYDAVATASSRLSLLGEFVEANNNDPSWGLAAEYGWTSAGGAVVLAGRVGYTFQPDNYLSSSEQRELAPLTEPENRGLDGLAFGGGLRYRFSGYEARFDYAFRHFGTLGTVNVYTIGFGWQ